MTTALTEGLSSLMQAARSRARGYRNPDTFTTMIYLIAGRLDFGLPSLFQPTSRQLARDRANEDTPTRSSEEPRHYRPPGEELARS